MLNSLALCPPDRTEVCFQPERAEENKHKSRFWGEDRPAFALCVACVWFMGKKKTQVGGVAQVGLHETLPLISPALMDFEREWEPGPKVAQEVNRRAGPADSAVSACIMQMSTKRTIAVGEQPMLVTPASQRLQMDLNNRILWVRPLCYSHIVDMLFRSWTMSTPQQQTIMRTSVSFTVKHSWSTNEFSHCSTLAGNVWPLKSGDPFYNLNRHV